MAGCPPSRGHGGVLTADGVPALSVMSARRLRGGGSPGTAGCSERREVEDEPAHLVFPAPARWRPSRFSGATEPYRGWRRDGSPATAGLPCVPG